MRRPIRDDAKLRHLAVQLAAQLPADVTEALAVIEYTKKIALEFLYIQDGPANPTKDRLRVVR